MDYQRYPPDNQDAQWGNQPYTGYPSQEGQYQPHGQQMQYQQPPMQQPYPPPGSYVPPGQPYPSSGAYVPPGQNMYPPQSPYAYNAPPGYNVDPDRSKAIAGLVLGIVGLTIWLIPFIGAPASIVASILGIVFSSQGRRSITGSSMATAGLVLSIIAIILVPILLLCTLGAVLFI